MQVTCRHCQHTIEFAGQPPDICAHCGQPFADRASEATLDYLPTADSEKTLVGEAVGGQAGAADERVGEYRLLRTIGQGGMGVVWEAEQAGTGRRVALKLLSPRLKPTAENVDRFLREGKLAASLSHPRSTFVFGAGQQDGQPYIAMELMPGRTLKDVLDDEGPLPFERAVDYILDAIDGLEAAHALGIIHRDVKPSNCFLDGDDRVKVGDFGLSKSLVTDAELTRTGTFLGTPQFAAPEQVKGGSVDQRTDVYAVGATLFCLLAGRGPFGGDAMAAVAQIVSDPAPRLRSIRPDVRQSLEQIVARTLEKDPARRFNDLAQLRTALAPFATGGVSRADVGWRLAAYMIDALLVKLVTRVIFWSMVLIFLRTAADGSEAVISRVIDAWPLGIEAAVWVCYFALAEAYWGRGVGKRLMGLRVVGPDGDRPGFLRSVVRSLIVPGAMWLVGSPFMLTLLRSEGLLPAPAPGFQWQSLVVEEIIPVMFILLCASSMRPRNGYRGWHEFASGTRVVRLRKWATARRQRIPVVLPVATREDVRCYGTFRSAGAFGHSGQLTVFDARDDLLGRAVSIYRGPRAAAMSDARRMVVRPTRPHWLHGAELADEQWGAFEAMTGAPLTDVVWDADAAAWQVSRHWLLDLCQELAAALADGTLPEALSLAQIWIGSDGRLKLLDAPLAPLGSPVLEGARHTEPGAGRALALLREATLLCKREQVVPPHVIAFADELASRPATAETLAWAACQLHDLVTQPAALGWRERFGVLAVSMGIEAWPYTLVAVVVPYLLLLTLRLPIERAAIVAPLALLLPALLGFVCRGGPAFWLASIRVLRTDGRAASRWRCAWRSFLAWSPLMACVETFVGFLMSSFMRQIGDDALRSIVSLGLTLFGALFGVLFVIGAIQSVVRPERGLQDELSGTWLAPQ